MPAENIHLKVEVELDNSFTIQPVSSLKITQRVDWHHSFEVKAALETIEDRQEINLRKTHDYVGKSIKIALRSQDGNTLFNLFKGIITEVSLSRFGGSGSEVLIRGYSPSILLDDGPHCMAFVDKTLKQVTQSIIGQYPVNLLSSKISPSTDPKIPFVVQYKESAFNFISRLANDYGQWFYYNGTDLIFGKLDGNEKAELSFGHNLSSFESSLRIAPLKFEAYGYDYVNNETLTSTSGSSTVSGLDNWGRKAVDQSDSLYSRQQVYQVSQNVASSKELDDLVLSRKSALAGELVVFSGVSDDARLKPGTKISVQGGSKATLGNDNVDYGSYTIVKISHYTDGLGNYQNRFEAIPSTLTIPPLNTKVKMPVCETQPAEVIDNKDPEGFGRLKVRFYWQPDGEMTPWVRYATAHAGKERGVYFLPEVGDEVLMSFEGDNPSRPVVFASLYHGKSHSGDRKDDDNFIKTIRTISGNEIQFMDKGGEEAIHIFNKDKQNEILITMKDDGLIRIVSNKNIYVEAKENIDVKAKNISFSADEKISFKSKEFVSEAQSLIQLDSMKDWKSKGTNVTTEAVSALKFSSATTEMKANATVEISGMAKTTVKANGQLELSAAAQASLKAGIVMIN